MIRFFTSLLITLLVVSGLCAHAGRLYAPNLTLLPCSFEDKAWNKTTRMAMQSLCGKKLDTPRKVWVKLGVFKDKLVIGLLAEKAQGQQLVANIKNNGDKVYLDDCFEFFIARHYMPKEYYHFIINANGAKLTETTPREASNYPWQAKTIIKDDSWSAIIILPLKKFININKSIAGQMVMVKIFRASPRKGVPSASIFQCNGGFHAIGAFGELVLGDKQSYYHIQKKQIEQKLRNLLNKTHVDSLLYKETLQLAKRWQKEAAEADTKSTLNKVIQQTGVTIKQLALKIYNQPDSIKYNKPQFSVKKSLLNKNFDKNIKKIFYFDTKAPAITVQVSVDPNISKSNASFCVKTDTGEKLAWMRIITNGGWTYIQFSAENKTKQIPTYTKNSALDLRMIYDNNIIKLEWRKAEGSTWHLLANLNSTLSPEKIVVTAVRDAIVRNIYSQTLVNHQVKPPFKLGEKLQNPLLEGFLEVPIPSPELIYSIEVQVNAKIAHSGGIISLISKKGNYQVWLKALSNGGWTYLQYGVNQSGIKTVKTFTKNDVIKLRIIYSKKTNNFIFEWGKATEKHWRTCARLKAPQNVTPQLCKIAVSKNGIIKSLRLDYLDAQRKAAVSVTSLNDYNKQLALKDTYKKVPFSASFCSPDVRLYPNLPFTKTKASEYQLWLCGGERQSFQLFLLPWQSTGKIKIKIEWPKVNEYIELGRVAYVDISKYSYSKIVGTNKIPDPIIDYKNQTEIALPQILPNQQTAIFITIDLPTKFPAGLYPGKIKIYNDAKQVIVMPVSMKVYPFSVTRTPNLVFPYSDTATALAAYTGFLRTVPKGNRYMFKSSNAEAYFDAVKQVSEDLVKHRVLMSRMSVCFIPPWFICKKQMDKYSCNGNFFEKTLQVMFNAGLQKIVIDDFSVKNAVNIPRVKSFLKELKRIIQKNSWQNNIIIKIGDEPRKENISNWIKLAKIIHEYNLKVMTSINHYDVAKKLLPYLDIYHGHIGDEKHLNIHDKPFWPYFNHMTLESSLSGVRSAVWKCEAAGADVYSYYAHNLWVFWNHGNPWNTMNSYVGLGETFRVYPPQNMPSYFTNYQGKDVPFKVISSLRWEATTTAIIDWLYIKKMQQSIKNAEKTNNSQRAEAGRQILKKLITKNSTMSENDLINSELVKVRKIMANYINNQVNK